MKKYLHKALDRIFSHMFHRWNCSVSLKRRVSKVVAASVRQRDCLHTFSCRPLCALFSLCCCRYFSCLLCSVRCRSALELGHVHCDTDRGESFLIQIFKVNIKANTSKKKKNPRSKTHDYWKEEKCKWILKGARGVYIVRSMKIWPFPKEFMKYPICIKEFEGELVLECSWRK